MAYQDNTYTADAINGLTGLLAGAIEAQATRPQKETVTTTTTTRPYALADMVANRDRIGQATSELNDALKAREGLGYTLASALAGVPQQQGAGSWLSDFARAFGGGMAAPTNAMVDRAQKKYEAEMKDLANILAYDKAMGDNQYQEQKFQYKDAPYDGGKQENRKVSLGEFGRSVDYDPIEYVQGLKIGPGTRAALDEEQMWKYAKELPLTSSLTKGYIGDEQMQDVQTIWDDISNNILSHKILDFVSQAGGTKIADTRPEQEYIFGPLSGYKTMNEGQLAQALTTSKNRFVSTVQESAARKGLEFSTEELENLWNSQFTKSISRRAKKSKGKNVIDANKETNKQDNTKTQESAQKTISKGFVDNGFRFIGGDPNDKNNWEAVK